VAPNCATAQMVSVFLRGGARPHAFASLYWPTRAWVIVTSQHVLVYPGYAANGLTRDVPDRFFALRLDEGGRPTWPAPIDLGEAALL
jgi:hypothetical protein